MALKTRNPRLSDLFDTPQKRTYTVAGVTVVLTIAMIFAVIRPSVARILTQISENQERQEVIDELDQKFLDLQGLVKGEDTFRYQLSLFDTEVFPDDRREDEFIANLSEGARILGVDLVTIGVSEDAEINERNLPSNVSTYILTASVIGSSSGVESFISLVENFPRTINIVEISEEGIDEDDFAVFVAQGKNIKLDVKGVVYFWDETPDETRR